MEKLLLDEMLKRTAKWLRIFGIDTEHASGRDDDALLEIADKERRILVTKDVELFSRCKKRKLTCHLLKNEKLEAQLAELKCSLGLKFTFPEKTRCPACNADLMIVPGFEVSGLVVSGLVGESVLERNSKFWKCSRCAKVYWEGSHWKNITRIFGTVEKLAERKTKLKR